MQTKRKIFFTAINLLIVALGLCGLIFLLSSLEIIPKIIAYVAIVIFGFGSIIFALLGKEKLAKSLFLLNVTTLIILAVFFILNLFGLFENFSDLEYIKNLILASGAYGVIICVLIQILQVVILPVPAVIFYFAVTAVYGWVWSFVICYLSTVIGSIIAFSIGRVFGRGAVEWCVGKETARKYAKTLGKKGKIPFIVMQLLPFFPDDVLCMIAGLSNMTYKFFILVIALSRPLYIFLACYFGRDNFIAFRGENIVGWVVVLAVILMITIAYFSNRKKVDEYFLKRFLKPRRKTKNN